MDKETTKTATKGYYIAILFKNDLSGFYMSLNQGWTDFRESRKEQGISPKEIQLEMDRISDYWRHELNFNISKFSTADIILDEGNSKSDLPKGYEVGNILSKYYSLSELPTNREFVLDLNDMLVVYRELIKNIKDLKLTNNKILLENVDTTIPVGDSIEIEFSRESFEEVDLDIDYEFKPNNFSHSKQDYEKINKKKRKLGLSGEEWVMRYEEHKLREAGLLSDEIKPYHTSKEDGDGMGYDIQSYDESGNEIYIEVKTTSGDKTTPFDITQRELERSIEDSEKFYLYRISDFKDNDKVKLTILKGSLKEQNFALQPLQYVTIYNDECD